jgi:DNA-3-methyladenine glycosylase
MSDRPKTIRLLPRAFYLPSAEDVAPKLLGKLLIHRAREGVAGGVIVETEAYVSEGDPANHASRGLTQRNRSMFGSPGFAYVYRLHQQHCLNVVCCPNGVAEAVLIRAVEPMIGVELMRQRRGRLELHNLASGPGKLCQALAITIESDGADLAGDGDLFICQPPTPRAFDIVTTTRVGIRSAQDLPLRFYIAGSPFVSRK